SVAVCATLSCRLRAIDPDFPDDPTGIFYRIAPMPYYPGSVQGSTGEYRFRGRPEDAGQVFEIGVAAHYGDTMTTGDQICRFWVRVDENQPPLFTGSLCHTLVNAPPGSPPFFEMQVEAVDPEECGPVALFVAGVSPLPVGGFTFDPEDGSFTMPLAPAELEETFTIRIGAADAVDTAYCEFDYRHLNRDPVAVMIERIGGDTPGGRHALDLTVTQNNLELQGFDLTIGFEAAALNLQGVSPGSVYDSCGWEYFTYRYGAGGACPECPSGILRLVGLAETNNGEAHPSCFRPAAPFSLATLEFLESAEPAWAGVFVPVRFLWLDCTANALAARLIAEIPEYTDLLISREVYDLDSVLAEDGEVYSFLAITDPLGTFPATGGAVGDCDAAAMPHPAPIRRVDFFNGGVKIAGPPATPVGEHNPDGTAGGPPLPSTFAVHQNCPNPFNLETVIPFDLPRQGRVTLEIYNTLGRRVYRQVGDYPAGYHRLVWDGRTDGGRVAASGVYVYRLATGETAAARKMMLLK
ncbi:MAG TPA: FlgD immunoglobulin-like domain containing protein, partial [candidate division Zixibacteria bacterium]|nr:FlgD immunoglobulin-like domain containing protein [candidate division Zixibacteria bacterium]